MPERNLLVRAINPEVLNYGLYEGENWSLQVWRSRYILGGFSMSSSNKKYFDKGVFTLSLDTELAWGMIDKPISLINNKEYFYNTRKVIDKIIELLEKYQISATWAVVGALLLERPSLKMNLLNL